MIRREVVVFCVGPTLLWCIGLIVLLFQNEPVGFTLTLCQVLFLPAVIVPAAILSNRVKRRVIDPFRRLLSSLREIVLKSEELELIADAQYLLDENLQYLRDQVYGCGDPSLDDGALFFGAQNVGAGTVIVDAVQDRYGGVATIFCRDRRVSTTARDTDGNRRTGSVLLNERVHQVVFQGARTYRGEVVILDELYIAAYEPIISGKDVIGALFVAVKTKDVLSHKMRDAIDGKESHFDVMANLLTRCKSAIIRRDDKLREVNDLRYHALDIRRVRKAHEREHASTQLSEARSMLGNSTNLAEAVRELSKRTEYQAATLEETSAAVQFITAAVKATAANVESARLLAANARTEADRSEEVVRNTIAAMGKIDASSAQIGQIVSLIDEIATQTNLLALNAAIEAARAGDSGSGFAVVAAEVRALAQRSADAAKAVKVLIFASSSHVTSGVDLVAEAGKAIDLISGKIHDVNAITDAIALSAKEQATTLTEINVAMNDLDRVTQENAAMVEQSLEATRRLAAQSARLEKLAVGPDRGSTAAHGSETYHPSHQTLARHSAR